MMKLKKSLIKWRKCRQRKINLRNKWIYIYSFKNFQTVKTFGRDIHEGKITIEEANEYQTNSLGEIMNLRKKKQEKEVVLENIYNFFEVREKVFDAFESKIFLTKSKDAGILNPDHFKLKVLTSKQMLQRLPIALTQVKAGNNSESLLNEIRQIVYYLYQSKQITKKVCNNIIKSINI